MYPPCFEHFTRVESYWGRDIWKGWALKDATKQIVVDLCKEPITYVYSLDVTIQNSDGTICTDTASYVYAIKSNEADESGYTQYKFRPYPIDAEVNRAPPSTSDGTGNGPVDFAGAANCAFCRSSAGRKATNRCQRKVELCMKRSTNVKKCINNKIRRYSSCCTVDGNKSCF